MKNRFKEQSSTFPTIARSSIENRYFRRYSGPNFSQFYPNLYLFLRNNIAYDDLTNTSTTLNRFDQIVPTFHQFLNYYVIRNFQLHYTPPTQHNHNNLLLQTKILPYPALFHPYPPLSRSNPVALIRLENLPDGQSPR